MRLRISNCPDPHFKPYVKAAAKFFSESLIKKKSLLDDSYLHICFTDKIEEQGYCSVSATNSKNKPCDFFLEIHTSLGAKGIISTLAHEMVHLKQFLLGEINTDITTWRGIKINNPDYWTSPWEIDAFGREPGLVTKFVIENKLWELFEGFKNPELPIVNESIKWLKTKNRTKIGKNKK